MQNKSTHKDWTLLSALCCYYVLRYEQINGRKIELRKEVQRFFGMTLDSVELKIDKNLKDEYLILQGQTRNNKGSTKTDKYVAQSYHSSTLQHLHELYIAIISKKYTNDQREELLNHLFNILPLINKKEEVVKEMKASGFPVIEINDSPDFDPEDHEENEKDAEFIANISGAKRRILSDSEIANLAIPNPNETTSKSFKRNPDISWTALDKADHKCEIDRSHKTFSRSQGKLNYVEPHHLIPISFQERFQSSLDIPANIISMCPNCHKAIHYAEKSERRALIEKCFIIKKNELDKTQLQIDLNQLFKMYKIEP